MAITPIIGVRIKGIDQTWLRAFETT